ncbi:MAG: DUF1330 domain-containing protein [Actinobacteria bacterium]|nr:DUF1330 domain-containing protein [Actinomycetota bacterium]
MAAYLIGNYNVTDLDGYREYQQNSAPILDGGGKLLVLDKESEKKEGDAGHMTVVIEYPTKDAALAAYESESYQSIVGLRHNATDNGRLVVVDGFG